MCCCSIWWIKNDDRKLSERGGNPNLFWEPNHRQLVVIDHNIALEDDLILGEFLEYHIFKGAATQAFGDFIRRDEYTERLSSALAHWARIRSSIPPEWLFLDAEMLDPISLDLDRVHVLLGQFSNDSFWKWQ